MADNLVLGRGKVFVQPYPKGDTTGGTKGYLGATPSFALAQSDTKLDHFSAEGGVKVKDRSVLLTQDMTVTLEVDNIMIANLALWFGGNDTDTPPLDAPGDLGTIAVIGRADSIFGAVFFESDNAEGDNVNYWFPYCSITPTGTFALKGDTWQVMTFTIEALKRDHETQRIYVYTPDAGTSAADDDTPLLDIADVAAAGSGDGGTGGGLTGGTVTAPGTMGALTPFYVSYTLTGSTNGWLQLYDAGTAVGGPVAAHGSPDITGPFVAPAAGTYTVKLFGTSNATGPVLATSGTITIS